MHIIANLREYIFLNVFANWYSSQARIALARAVYSDADLYLLDDPLSACDAEVGRVLFFECILRELRARGKGVLLCTHQLQYLPHADRIIVLDRKGNQRFTGTPNFLCALFIFYVGELLPFVDRFQLTFFHEFDNNLNRHTRGTK